MRLVTDDGHRYLIQATTSLWYMQVIHRIFSVNYEHDSTLRELQRSVENAETAMPLKIWHDHSTVEGHSTLLVSVAFMYNTNTYLTAEESRM